MPQDVTKPRDNGQVQLPKIVPGQNKYPPNLKERTDEEKKGSLGSGTKDKRDEAAILERMRKRMKACIQAESENRKDAVDDLNFKAAKQWPSDVQAQRAADKRPCLTINKIPTFIHQVTNAQRENRPAINVSPVGEKGDPEAAKMYRGLIRAIERDSSADIAYDTAFESSVSMGWGYWRILTQYDDEDSFDQVIIIQRIRNPFTIYMDPASIEPECCDAKYAFVSEMLTRDEFKEEYPDAVEIPWQQSGQGDTYKDWVEEDRIRVAEYYELEVEQKRLVMLENGHEGFYDDLSKAVKDRIASNPDMILDERTADCCRVCWYKATANEIIDEADWPGKWIPIVRVIGNEIDIEGKLKLSGLIRDAKDPQRMYNYWKTSETELIALAPKAPYIMAEGQQEGHTDQWKQANTKSFPYLLYKPTTIGSQMAPPPQRQPFADIPAGVVNATQGAAQDMMAVTGIRFDATMNERMVDESGVAVRELRRSGDIGSFHYLDNLGRALKHTGRILIDLIPKIYDTKRIVTILREDDHEENVQIDPSMNEPYKETMRQDGKFKMFNPTLGKFGVTVTIGPSYATKRIEAAESMLDFIKAVPPAGPVVMDLIAKNQDWPGAEEIASRLAKTLPPNLLTPDQKDVPPQISALIQGQQAQIKQMGVQMQGLQQALQDKTEDRRIAQDKIDKDFEAKLLTVVEKYETAAAERQQHMLKDLAEGVKTLIDSFRPEATSTGSKPNGSDSRPKPAQGD